MGEFFGINGFQREPEGFLSWQHLLFVSLLMVCAVVSAILFARKFKNKDEKSKNKVLIGAALVIDILEIGNIVFLCIANHNPLQWVYNNIPLYLCSIMLIALPLAAFSRGRLREASLDFVMIFGMLAALVGTYGAGNNYSCYPVLSYINVVSGLEHVISGFAALYIGITRMARLKKENMGFTYLILLSFCLAAYLVDRCLTGEFAGRNYMFLMRGDGTPYDLLYNLVGGSPVLYPLGVVLLFVLYVSLFYLCFYMFNKKRVRVKQNSAA